MSKERPTKSEPIVRLSDSPYAPPVHPQPGIYETTVIAIDVPLTDEDRERNVTKKTHVITPTFVEMAAKRHWSFAKEDARARRRIREKRTADARKAEQRKEAARKGAETRRRNKEAATSGA